MACLKNKNIHLKLTAIIFLIFLSGLFFNLKPAKAALTEFIVYGLFTSDPTPTIKGIVSDADADITITVNGKEYHPAVVGNTWSVTIPDDDALDVNDPLEDYDISGSATLGEDNMGTTAILDVLAPGFPLEIYYVIGGGDDPPELNAVSIEFLADFPHFEGFLEGPSFDPGFSINMPEGTTITPSEGNTFPLFEWNMDSLDSLDNDLLRIIEFGVPDFGLEFSLPIDISVDIDSSYNGRTLNIFTRQNEGLDQEGWEHLATCLVTDGSCNFSVSHASFFGISEQDELGGNDHRGGVVYKKYKEYKEKFKTKEDKQRYFKIKWLKKNQKETYLYYKSVYESHKFDKDSEFNKLSAEIKEIYKDYRGYNGYKNYREYKEKVY